MGLYVLDNVKLYEADEDNLVHLAFGDSVWTGCQVVAHGSPDMGVRVGVGSIRYAGVNRAVAQTDLTVTAADPTNPRIDLVHIAGATGVPAIIAGTAASTPKPPALPAASILVGFVSVAAAAVNIQSSNITDRRLLASDGVVGGLDANKPAAGFAGRLYAARDTGILYHDDGATLAAIGGGSAVPNLVLNSDFGRRTIYGLAMPEAFPDTSGYLQRDGGAAPTVAGNILTQGAVNNLVSWPKSAPGNFWRDGRASATFKAVSTTGQYLLNFHHVDGNNFVRAFVNGAGNALMIRKMIAGAATDSSTVSQALTLNRWYWIELEAQGTTYIMKLYDTGGTVAGVTKAASTLLQTLTFVVADAAVVAGDVAIQSDQAAAQWGGIATGNGGVYVETWLPESYNFTWNAGGLGGQAVGYDEAADAGPIGKQAALRFYIPPAAANMRRVQVDSMTPDGSGIPSVGYAASFYLKTSGATVNGMLNGYVYEAASNGTLGASHTVADAGEASWTRKTATAWTNASTARRFAPYFYVGDLVANHGGTFWIGFHQIEQGSAVTAWRNAPADDAPIMWILTPTTHLAAYTTTAGSPGGEIDPRNLAANLYLPWDATVTVSMNPDSQNSAGSANVYYVNMDGANFNGQSILAQTGGLTAINFTTSFTGAGRAAAGKHRFAVLWWVVSGTGNLVNQAGTTPVFVVTAYRGK